MGGWGVIGLISDTHSLLRRESVAALQGSDLIIHAGDVGKAGILEELKALAPIVAVKGNVDKGEWADELPITATVEIRSARIYVLHDINELAVDPVAQNFDFVISGHSHKPGRTERDGVIYINPGSAGPRRFRLPITVARLNLNQDPWTVEFVDLL
jgi:uncharacterized protein